MSDSAFYTAAQCRELDRIAIEELALPGFKLMQRAAVFAFSVLRKQWPDARTLAVCCGAGNNAGDGYLVAKLAVEQGLSVNVVELVDPAKLKGDAAQAESAWRAIQQSRQVADGGRQLVLAADVVVDALLGTGLTRPIADEWVELIEMINQRHGHGVLAIDIPSGLNADTGQPSPDAVVASHTATFIGRKLGLITGQGAAYSGALHFDDLAVPASVYDRLVPIAKQLDGSELADLLPKRKRTAHKGQFGHVLVIGGNHGIGGAARLAAEAALRVGAGLVSVAVRPGNDLTVMSGRPELMCRGISHSRDLSAMIHKATVIVCGPGLGLDAWAVSMLGAALDAALPLVLDADALTLSPEAAVLRTQWVLTPHPGEAGRLLGEHTSDVERDRYAAVQKIRSRYGGVCVLKGAGTLVADENDTWCCVDGNPGMASGGMGDVLSGVVGGLIAQNLSVSEAARTAVWLHAAADQAAQSGERGLLASDLFPELRRLCNLCS